MNILVHGTFFIPTKNYPAENVLTQNCQSGAGAEGFFVIRIRPNTFWIRTTLVMPLPPVPGSLDKKRGGRRFHLNCIFCYIKRFHLFQHTRRLTNPTQLSVVQNIKTVSDVNFLKYTG
jgi:hypothetical protein